MGRLIGRFGRLQRCCCCAPRKRGYWSPTYLGGIADEGAECNGVIFRVTPAEFDSYTQRETGYRPTEIDPSQITMLDGLTSSSALHPSENE